jgi:hypothetical protein
MYFSSDSLAPTDRAGFQFNKKGGVQIRTAPQIKHGSTQAAALRPFGLIVFLFRFVANSLATAFWSF